MTAVTVEETATGIVGIDLGSRRVGVAAADPTHTIATPLLMIERNHPQFWSKLAQTLRDRDCGTLVVGLPLNLDGGDGDAADASREFAAEAAVRLGVLVELWDERFTTAQAERSLISQGMRRQQRRQVIDSVAAALMLQAWLDSRGRLRQ